MIPKPITLAGLEARVAEMAALIQKVLHNRLLGRKARSDR